MESGGGWRGVEGEVGNRMGRRRVWGGVEDG